MRAASVVVSPALTARSTAMLTAIASWPSIALRIVVFSCETSPNSSFSPHEGVRVLVDTAVL